MNSRSWRNDDLGQLIRHALRETVDDARPSRQVWLNIKSKLARKNGVQRKAWRWRLVTIPSFQISFVLVLLLALIGTLPWNVTTQEDSAVYDGFAIEPTAQVASSELPAPLAVDDHPSEPSPIVVRAKDLAVRRALATAVDRGVFEGTLRSSESEPLRQHDTSPVQKLSLARARDVGLR